MKTGSEQVGASDDGDFTQPGNSRRIRALWAYRETGWNERFLKTPGREPMRPTKIDEQSCPKCLSQTSGATINNRHWLGDEPKQKFLISSQQPNDHRQASAP